VYHKDRDLFAAVQDYRERMYEIVDLSDEIVTLSRLLEKINHTQQLLYTLRKKSFGISKRNYIFAYD
jgi:hypothetical protein